MLGSRKRVVALFLVLTTSSSRVYFTLAHVAHDVLRRVPAARGRDRLLGRVRDDGRRAVRHQPARDGDHHRAELRARRGRLAHVRSSRRSGPSLGVRGSAIVVGLIALSVAFAALRGLHETFGKDLDYIERH